jgi:putative ABC transport system substrate-binding protein
MTADKSRRLFIRHSVAAVIALPRFAFAQTAGGTRRVAVLLASSPATASHFLKALGGGLADLGWVEGRNLQLDVRYGENDAARFQRLAAELLALRPDVFVAGNEPVAREVVALTKTVPIVVPISFDPVGAGLVRSLASPGGNVTGFSILIYELMPKRLQLLKEAVPGLKRVAVMYLSGDVNADRVFKLLAEPAKQMGITIVPVEIRDLDGLEMGFKQVVKQNAGGLLPVPGGFFFQHRVRIADLAIKNRLAFAQASVEAATAGSLFGHGANFAALFRRSATLVDKILKGANPANIPLEQANVYELVVNLKTARALGIKLPPSFLVQVTQTID